MDIITQDAKVSSRGGEIFVQTHGKWCVDTVQSRRTHNISLAQTIQRNNGEFEGQVAPPQALQQRANAGGNRADKEALPVLSEQNDTVEQALPKGVLTVLSNALQNHKEIGLRNLQRKMQAAQTEALQARRVPRTKGSNWRQIRAELCAADGKWKNVRSYVLEKCMMNTVHTAHSALWKSW